VLGRGKDRAPVLVHDVDRAAVAAARRDPRAFEALYRKYVAQIYNFALYELRDVHAAEDLTAQVFVRALAGLPRFREQGEGAGSSFRGWLFQIARHALANERRRARRRPETALDLAELLPADVDLEQAATTRAELDRVLAAIGRLPAERRQALLLRFVHEMDAAEIGQVMGRSSGAVRVLIHRALRSVTRQLGSNDRRRVD
jgi:RNA polymerase sigma-70 factor (ECF subfamily)